MFPIYFRLAAFGHHILMKTIAVQDIGNVGQPGTAANVVIKLTIVQANEIFIITDASLRHQTATKHDGRMMYGRLKQQRCANHSIVRRIFYRFETVNFAKFFIPGADEPHLGMTLQIRILSCQAPWKRLIIMVHHRHIIAAGKFQQTVIASCDSQCPLTGDIFYPCVPV